MNLAPLPSQKASQTIKAPHFHFSLMRNEAFTGNGLKVASFEIDTKNTDHQKKLALRESSTILTQYLAHQMKYSLVERVVPTAFFVELPNQFYFADEANILAFQEVQREVWEFLMS